MTCAHWEPGSVGHCSLRDRHCSWQGESARCPDAGLGLETRNDGLMRQAARLLAAAGGYRFRHYLVKVDSGRAMCIEEYDPPRARKTVL